MAKKKNQAVLVFDLTGSMAGVRGEVRANNCRLVDQLFEEVPHLEMAVIAVGDDPEQSRYMIRYVPLTTDRRKLIGFIDTVPNANGGDFDECYELALNVANSFSWDENANKTLVMLGDAYPHPVSHPKNREGLNWREEARELAESGVTIYAVHALAHYGDSQVVRFWKDLAQIGNGIYLTLDQFRHVERLLLGIGHHTVGTEQLEAYVGRLERDGSISVGLGRSFDAMLGRKSRVRKRSDGRNPIDASKFQVLTCTAAERQDVREFAVDKGVIEDPAEYNARVKGHIFYAHTERTETLRPNHHVVIQDVATDQFFTGDEARQWLGIPYGTSGRLSPNPLGPGFRVWIQSKSMNRKVFPGQEVMVEMVEGAISAV